MGVNLIFLCLGTDVDSIGLFDKKCILGNCMSTFFMLLVVFASLLGVIVKYFDMSSIIITSNKIFSFYCVFDSFYK